MQCPSHSILLGAYDSKAGGTGQLDMWSLQTMAGHYIHIQFYEVSGQIRYWEYDANWRPVGGPTGSGVELNPIEASSEISKALYAK